MKIDKIYIIGLGQIGKTIANTLKKNGFNGKIFGCDINADNINRSLIDDIFNINDIKCFSNSIFFICVNPLLNKKYLEDLIDLKKDSADFIISDVCSVKNFLFESKKICNCKNFISLHPMNDGSSNDGNNFYFKKYTLNYIIDTTFISKYYVDFLAQYLNFKNVVLDCQKHDKIVSIISHLTNIIECCYSNTYDKIRGEMWQEILQLNKENITNTINDFIIKLKGSFHLNESIKIALLDLINDNQIVIKDEFQNPSLKRILNINDKENCNDMDLFINRLKCFYDN